MAELKTRATNASVAAYLAKIADPAIRADCMTLIALMKQASGAEPKMWGTAIVGFGDLRYTYASGREGDWFLTGFAPRKGALTVYLMAGMDEAAPLLAKLGPHKRSNSCLYLKNLDAIDRKALGALLKHSIAAAKKRFAPAKSAKPADKKKTIRKRA